MAAGFRDQHHQAAAVVTVKDVTIVVTDSYQLMMSCDSKCNHKISFSSVLEMSILWIDQCPSKLGNGESSDHGWIL